MSLILVLNVSAMTTGSLAAAIDYVPLWQIRFAICLWCCCRRSCGLPLSAVTMRLTALGHAGGDARGLHPHGARQGTARADHHQSPCAQEALLQVVTLMHRVAFLSRAGQITEQVFKPERHRPFAGAGGAEPGQRARQAWSCWSSAVFVLTNLVSTCSTPWLDPANPLFVMPA